jgi:hypothetical protein
MTSIYQYGDRDAAIVTIRRISTFIRLRLEKLTSKDNDIAAAFQAAMTGLDIETSEDDPSLGVLVGYLQAAIRQPALEVGFQLDDRFDAFSFLADDCLSLLDGSEITGYRRWQTKAVELTLCAVVGAMARVITTSTPDTRAHSMTIAGRLIDEFADIVDALDTVAEEFENQDWEARYFSQTGSFTVMHKLVASCLRFLLMSAYDLKIEKRYKVKQPTTPIEIAIKEYSNYEIEEGLDLFIKANALSGDEILLLPSGREIVIYV